MKFTAVWNYIIAWIQTRTNRNVVTKTGLIYKRGPVCYKLDKKSEISLFGNLEIGTNAISRKSPISMLRMDEDAKLLVKGMFSFYYGADVIVFRGGVLECGNGFINSGCKIRCFQHIAIGNNCKISHDVTIMDSDAHGFEGKNRCGEVIIEDDVWIATRVTILKGVHIGRGSVVGAGSVVTKDIPPYCLAAGVPARVIRKDIKWSD